MSVEIEKMRAATSPLVGSGKELKESDVGNSPTSSGLTSVMGRIPNIPNVSPNKGPHTTYPSIASLPLASIPKDPPLNFKNVDRSFFRTAKPKGAYIESFEFKQKSKARNSDIIMSVQGCKIKGIRRVSGPSNNIPLQYADEGYRWIKLESEEYRLHRAQIIEWLEFWGELASEITEYKIEGDRDDSESGHSIGNGTYSVKIFPSSSRCKARESESTVGKLPKNARTASAPMLGGLATKNVSTGSIRLVA
jgi:hypothetical protein